MILPNLQVGIRTLFVNPADDHIPACTTAEIVREIGLIHGATAHRSDIRKKMVNRVAPKDQKELLPRRMKDSFVTAVIPLKKNSSLRERYVTFYDGLRIGRLLEDLDIFAAWACHKHIINPAIDGEDKGYPFVLVTAIVDRVSFSGAFLKANEDVRLSGHVSWVGISSIEVAIVVDQKNEAGIWIKLTSAKFVFVARHPLKDGPVTINPLVGDTEAEKAYIQRGKVLVKLSNVRLGEKDIVVEVPRSIILPGSPECLVSAERQQQRKLATAESVYQKPPNEEERELIHKLFVATMDPTYGGFRPINPNIVTRPSNTRWMEESRLNTLLLCHPQYRNMFDKIFGGLIMRKAYELAFSNAFMYTKSRPSVLSIDDIKFRKPVEIGALLRFGAEVAYVEDYCVHVPVIAEVLNPLTGESHVTNIFHFTFLSSSETPPPTLLPKTYQEAMVYLNARRHFKLMEKQYLSNQSNVP